MKLFLGMDLWIIRKGWFVVLRTPNLPDMKSQLYRRKKDAERSAAESVMKNPELIGRVFVERGEEKVSR